MGSERQHLDSNVKLWCITGLHGPNWINNTRENFQRCKLSNARHIIVENGKGVGLWPEPLEHEVVIQSKPGAAQYINAGIDYIRKHGTPDDWFVKFDSDDFYGEQRLQQILDLAEQGAMAVGATDIYVKTESDKIMRIDAGTIVGEPMHRPHMPHGPTLAAKMSVTLPFPYPKEAWGEDAYWVEAMRDAGYEFWALPLEGFAYVRHRAGTHTFPVPEDYLRHVWRVDVFDAGPWDIDVIEGRKKPPSLMDIPHEPMKMHDAFDALLDIHIKNMKIHEVKEDLMKQLIASLNKQHDLEKQVGAIQVQIEGARKKSSP
jgi:hypothetical protein